MHEILNSKTNYIVKNRNRNRKSYKSILYSSRTSALLCSIAFASVASLNVGVFAGSANAAQFGQSGKGGDGGYSWLDKKEGEKGKPNVAGKGGDGGEGGTLSIWWKAGSGGTVGSTDPDQAGPIQGGSQTHATSNGCGGNAEAPCRTGGAGGGGGGAGLVLEGKDGESHGTITGGNGGVGNSNWGYSGGAGEGGNGGAGFLQNGGSFQNNHSLTGGNGGGGGSGGTGTLAGGRDAKDCIAGTTCYSGRGGDGGAGADIRGGAKLTNNKTIIGGDGGAGGTTANGGTNYKLGDGGDGGNGVEMSDGGTLFNSGAITGGKAGTNPFKSTEADVVPGKDGADGIGIYAKGDNNTVVNKKGGVISAGGASPKNGTAVKFEGDNNTFERQNGSIINGKVEATGKNNGFSLGGDEDQNFDVSEFGSEYVGFERFQKDGKGTAEVSGVATYSGETVINDGTLKLTKNANLESSSGVKNNAKFDITAIDSDSTKIKTLTGDKDDAVVFLGGKELIITDGSGSYAGKLDGNEKGKFTIAGGHETLTGDNSGYKGGTDVKSGAELTIDKDLGGTTDVEKDGILSGAGSVQNLINGGIFVIGTDKGFTNKTIKGDYIGKDGTIVFNTQLGDDNSPTDHLDIKGNTSGTSNVKVNNRDGLGAQTNKGIDIISVGGKSDGLFNLIGDYKLGGRDVIEAGAYAYGLKKGGEGGNENDIYLTSQLKDHVPQPPCEKDGTCPPPAKPDTYGASVPLMSAYTQALRTFNTATTLQDRVGNRYWTGSSARQIAQGDGPGVGNIVPTPNDNSVLTDYGLFWSKISGRHDRFQPTGGSIDYNSSVNTWTFNAGVDNQLYETDAGRFIGGVWFEYGRIDASISSNDRNGKIKADGYGGGASLTWYGDNGLYVDGLGKVDWYRNDINSDKAGGLSIVNGAKGFGYALSIETGKRFELNDSWSLTPQVQLSWSSLDMDDFRNVFGSTDSFDRQNDLTARLGLTANYANTWQGSDGFAQRTSFYVGANLYQTLTEDKSNVSISVVGRPNEVSAIIDPGSIGKTWAGIGAGGTYAWHDNKYSIFGNVNTASSTKNFGDSYTVSGNIGMSVKW